MMDLKKQLINNNTKIIIKKNFKKSQNIYNQNTKNSKLDKSIT